jgi:hypothetical protein
MYLLWYMYALAMHNVSAYFHIYWMSYGYMSIFYCCVVTVIFAFIPYLLTVLP